ncbi:hypothetical protein E5221_12680 [Pseudomonas sp. A2]|nr:hypothetical protein E5221_12680 [Pseudomonas sp. A2]
MPGRATRSIVGAALCRERAAKRPQDFSSDAQIAGAALQPFRDTRPLLHGPAHAGEITSMEPPTRYPSSIRPR